MEDNGTKKLSASCETKKRCAGGVSDISRKKKKN